MGPGSTGDARYAGGGSRLVDSPRRSLLVRDGIARSLQGVPTLDPKTLNP